MKKFLSLVLALVMAMSLVTVSAGAKDFADADDITYDEAVSVISTIGVVDGNNGGFLPTDGLTRGAAAKIICNLVLGPTTASALNADAAPFNTLQATIVDYDQKVSVNVGGAEVNLTNNTAKPVGGNNNNYQTGVNHDGNIKKNTFVQFAEQYFTKLTKQYTSDDFGRPAYLWKYDGDEMGTCVDYTLRVAEYTTAVTGADLYDLLTYTIVSTVEKR